MSLPEHEQRQLREIEQALFREDPKFGRIMCASDPRVHYERRLMQALLGVVIGTGLLAAGAVIYGAYLEAAGVVIVLLSLGWAVVSWRQYLARLRPARSWRGPTPRKARSSGPGRPGEPGWWGGERSAGGAARRETAGCRARPEADAGWIQEMRRRRRDRRIDGGRRRDAVVEYGAAP